MIKALAPVMRRGCSWVWLWVALAGVLPSSAVAQDGKKSATPSSKTDATKKGATKSAPASKKDAAKAADAARKKAAAGADDEPADDAPEAPPSGGSAEVLVFTDPHAEQAVKVFKTVAGLRDTTPANITAVKNMASGGPVDRDAIQRFVQGMAFRLTDRSNINGLINPPPSRPPSRAIQDAVDNLMEALNTAKQSKNSSFLSAFNQELVATLPKLLDNNLISRIQAMIVLGQTGSGSAVPVFLAQLKDTNQTVWVQLWAARGLYNVVEGGTRVDSVISAQDAISAGKALSDFLEREKDLPWPARVRALEAMGAMRQAAVPSNMQKAEMASTAMKFLADPDAHPEVRAAAAWALGMMRVNPAIARYNFALIAHNVGLLAADLGSAVNASFSENSTRSAYLSGLLAGPVYQAFNGVEGARESGLLKVPGANPNLATIKQIADASSSIARGAVDLSRPGPAGQVPNRKKDLGDRVSVLKSFLEKNAPKDFHLVPGGPEYRGGGGAVAGAAVEKAKVAGARGGR